MCQMPNIWHIWHTKHQKTFLSDVPNLIKFATYEQYCCKFATIRTKNGIWVNNFLFSFLSHLSSLYSFLFSLTSVLSHRFPLHSSHLVRFFFFFNLRSVWRWPLSPKAQATWQGSRVCRSRWPRLASSPLMAHKPSSSPTSKMRRAIVIVTTSSSSSSLSISRISLSLSFGGWLFWLLLVG